MTGPSLSAGGDAIIGGSGGSQDEDVTELSLIQLGGGGGEERVWWDVGGTRTLPRIATFKGPRAPPTSLSLSLSTQRNKYGENCHILSRTAINVGSRFVQFRRILDSAI